jgi:hypothetical protein
MAATATDPVSCADPCRKLSGIAMIGSRTALAIFLLASTGCHAPPSPAAIETSPRPTAASSTFHPGDSWLGQWDGPEGTYLRLSKVRDHYAVEIHDLDGSRTFEGFPAGDRIRFIRDGKTEFLAAGNGEEAGMKWLLDRKNCLLTRRGEGWCRD